MLLLWLKVNLAAIWVLAALIMDFLHIGYNSPVVWKSASSETLHYVGALAIATSAVKAIQPKPRVLTIHKV